VLKRSIVIAFLLISTHACLCQSQMTRSTLKQLNEYKDNYNEARFEAYQSGVKGSADSIPKPPKFTETYIYPSVLRAFNIEKDPTWTQISRDMRKVVGYQVSEHPKMPCKKLIQDYSKNIQGEGYELWLEMSGETDMSLFVKEEDDNVVGAVYLLKSNENLTVVDYIGFIDPALLLKFAQNPQESILKSLPKNLLNFLPAE
jgi:hypothetical protein